MSSERRWNTESFLAKLEPIWELSDPPILIGGQAVNLWGEYFSVHNPGVKRALTDLRPLTSCDADFLGGRDEAKFVAYLLDGEASSGAPFGRVMSPVSGTVTMRDEEGLTVHFLLSPRGASSSEISRTAREVTFSGRKIRVIHPNLLFESKIDCLYGLPQTGRQDLKHIRIMSEVLRGYMEEAADRGSDKELVSCADRAATVAFSPVGLQLWSDHAIDASAIVPLSTIEKVDKERARNFLRQRWPRLIERIASARASFSNKRARLAELADQKNLRVPSEPGQDRELEKGL